MCSHRSIVLVALLVLNAAPLSAQNLFGKLFSRKVPTADERLLGDEPIELGQGKDAVPEGAVLFVHGYDSDSGGWRKMAESLRRKGFARLHAVDLPDQGKEATIETYAQVLARRIRAISKGPDDRVTLVAHSMGGLVCRRYLSEREAAMATLPSRRALPYARDPAIPMLITMGSPHHGTSFFTSDFLGSFRSEPLVVSRTQMATGSAFVNELNRSPLPRNTEIHSLWVEHDGVILPPASSVLEGASNHQIPDWCSEEQGFGHLSMRRADAMTDAVEGLLLGKGLPKTGPQTDAEAEAHSGAWRKRRAELRRAREAREALEAEGDEEADGSCDPADAFDDLHASAR